MFHGPPETIGGGAKSNLTMSDHDLSSYAWPFLLPIFVIGGSFLVAIVGMMSRARVRELEIRERIAMIERGLVPPPEADPGGFERRMQAMDRMHHGQVGPRFRAAGIIIMSVGFGLMTLLGFVGVVREGIGVGGFLVIMGLGFVVNSLFSSPHELSQRSSPRLDPPADPPAQS
jgi:hypothetical protein